MFLTMSTHASPCESTIHLFRITDADAVTGLSPLPGGAVPGVAAGLAVSPDGSRIAFSTLPCRRR